MKPRHLLAAVFCALTLASTAHAQPPAEQEKFVADFQTTLKSLIGDVEKVEAALKAGNMDEAKTLAAALRMDQMDAHTQFRKPQAGRGGAPGTPQNR